MIAEVFPTAIPLRRHDGSVRAVTLVDADTFEWASKHRWCLSKGYAVRQADSKMVYLHREVAGATQGTQPVDHITRDRLDNRRVNLRLLTKREDCQNKPSLGGTSQHRGVCWDKARRRWKATAQLDGRTFHIGRFRSETEAAQAASDWRRKHMPYSVEPDALVGSTTGGN